MVNKRSALMLIAVSLFAAVLTAHADETALTADRPPVEVFRTELNRETSTINIPVEMSADELAKILNQTIRKQLYRGSTKTRGLSADVMRNGPIVLSAADNFLYITLPVTMSLNYGMFETAPIPLTLKFRATAGVTPDWRLHADIVYLGVSDIPAGEVGLGPLAFNPRSIVESVTQPMQKELSGLVTEKINTLLPLKIQAAKVWNSAQTPVLLDRNYKTWLKLTLQDVLFYPLYARNNRVKLSVGITTYAEVVVGPEPAAHPLRPLPDLKRANTFDKTFRIALNADVFYKDLQAIAAPQLLNRQFDSDGNSVIIKAFELSGNGDRLVVKLETEGTLDGVLYLTARPVFNPQTNIFSVEDVDFDLQTRSLLLKSADWFLHGTIREMIREKLNMNLTRQLEQSRELAAKALSRMQLMEHVFLKCNIKDLKFKDVLVQKDKISIQVYTEGESAVLFQ